MSKARSSLMFIGAMPCAVAAGPQPDFVFGTSFEPPTGTLAWAGGSHAVPGTGAAITAGTQFGMQDDGNDLTSKVVPRDRPPLAARTRRL